MLQVLDKAQGNLIALRATGKLRKEDYENFIPVFKGKIAQYDKVRWYFEMKDFEGWTFSAFLEEIKFDLKNASKFERVAIVGDKTWEKWMTEVSKLFTSAEVKFFKLENKEMAMKWVQSSL